jgi:3-methyladenine DNA glycosylase/8-oxoguanine DNA glycosylase
MILRRYTNANGDQQEIILSQEDWEKVTEESLELMLGFKKAAEAVVDVVEITAEVQIGVVEMLQAQLKDVGAQLLAEPNENEGLDQPVEVSFHRLALLGRENP